MMITDTPILGLVSALLVVFVLVWPMFLKMLQMLLVYWCVPWKNSKGEKMPGQLPHFPFGHFTLVNFFGRPLSQKYGPIYYIWHCFTPVVILSDAKAIRTFYNDHYSHHREEDFICLGSVFKDVLGKCLATSHGREEVRRCRGPFEKYFSVDAVTDNLQVIGRECSAFMKTLPIGQPIDLLERDLAGVTQRVVVHMVYGGQVLEKYSQRIHEIGGLLQKSLNMVNVGMTRLPFSSHLPTKANQTARSFTHAWEGFNRFLFNEYEEGRLSSGDSLFFSTMEQVKTRAIDISEKELFHSVDEILLFNIDVSFAATSFALADLAECLDIQEKLRCEVDDVLRGHDPSTFPDLDKKLPYLEMVLKESARMHPALALSLPEKTVKPMTDMSGYLVPKGTTVCVDTFSLNYSETYWENPEQFNPERFANGTHQTAGSYFRFGMGPRKCLGYRYALAITRIVVVSFLQKYTLHLTSAGAAPRVKSTGIAFFTPYICPEIILNERF